MTVPGRSTGRIILFPLPLQGHVSPMLQLAQLLRSRGFAVTVVHSTFNPPNPSNYPDLEFHSIPCGFHDSEIASADLILRMNLLITRCEGPFTTFLEESLRNGPLTCLVTDSWYIFAQEVANKLGVTRLVLRTGSATSLSLFADFPLLFEKGYYPIQGSRLEEEIIEFPPLKVKDLPAIGSQGLDEIPVMVGGMVSNSRNSSGVIINTFDDIESESLSKLREQLRIPVFPIGPFHKCFPASSSSLLTADGGCISWLDGKPPQSVIYISFGSIAAVTDEQIQEIALGLASSNCFFLWVIREGGSGWLDQLPAEFLPVLEQRGKIVNWAPQQEVLVHPAVGAFWTHNGWNSTLESLCEGVPMICMPFFTDQTVNARYVTNVWKVGVHLENKIERGNIEMAIKQLFKDHEGKQMRDRVTELKEKAASCLQQGGSSHESLNELVDYFSSLNHSTFSES
ncbi:hypothetical protein MLD38_038158 [Melastoma candidum]|uniref:Uncharacterized protein n=1 Tax=Melastoma candidum TaxID=119954 RepID=A0ACB9KY36_9MYRT|nr:hypothetical protein MLD38_038158 [Melastoma candidum]